MSKNNTGRWYAKRKAYKKARVKKLAERFYRRVRENPVVLARYNNESGTWE